MKFTRSILLQQADVRITGNEDFEWSFETDNVTGATEGLISITETTTTGSGTGATFDLTIAPLPGNAKRIDSLLITNAGTGYAAGDVITIPQDKIPNSSGGDVKIKLNALPNAPENTVTVAEENDCVVGLWDMGWMWKLIFILIVICVLSLIVNTYAKSFWNGVFSKIFGTSKSELFHDIEVSSMMTNLSQL